MPLLGELCGPFEPRQLRFPTHARCNRTFNLQKNPFVGRQPSLQAGGILLGRRTAQLGANLAVRTGGHIGRTMCRVLVYLAPGPKLGRQNRRNLELNTAPEIAPA